MLPSMPSICTPLKDEPSQESTVITKTKYAPCASPSDTIDIDLLENTPEHVSPTSPKIEHCDDSLHSVRAGERTPPKLHEIGSVSPLSFSMKKSSPLKLVNPILKKYNTHRQGKIMKRSVSPMHIQSHLGLTYAQTYFSHSDDFEPKSHNDEEYGNGDNEADLQALMAASSTVPRTPKGKQAPLNKKKRLKELRDAKVMLTLLSPDSEQYLSENAKNFAQAYFRKLQERLAKNGDEELFDHILQLLAEFEAKTVPVKELYERVVSSLHGYPDLAELFNMFLLPEQAMECGKFMEYVKLTNMKTFVRKLETFFAKQPQQLRHILATLTTLSEQPDVTLNEVKKAVLPLLRGNTFLMDSFLFLFPTERPPDSLMTDFEDMEVDSDDHSGDEEESVLIPDREDNYGTDNCSCLCHSTDMPKFKTRRLHCFSCGTKFIHGKVYVHIGRVLRSAKVSFPGFSDDIIQQRLGVKASRKSRRKNSCSPSKTPHDGHCDEKGDTDDEPKSSSPKCCKIAKSCKVISPMSKLRTNGLKQCCHGCKCEASDASDYCNEEQPTEDPMHDCIVNDITEIPTSVHPCTTITTSSFLTNPPLPSSAPCNTTNIALPTFGSNCSDKTSVIQPLTQQNILASEIFPNDISCGDNISIGSGIDFYTCNTMDSNTPLIIGNVSGNEVFTESLNDFQMVLMDTSKPGKVTHTPLESLQSEFTKDMNMPLRAGTSDLQHIFITIPGTVENKGHQSSVPSINIKECSAKKTESTKDVLLSESLLVGTNLVSPVAAGAKEPCTLTSTMMSNLDLENRQSDATSINTPAKSTSEISSIHRNFPATLTEFNDDASISTKTVFSSMGFNYDSLKYSAQMSNSSTSNDCFSLSELTTDPSLLFGSASDCLTFLEQMSDSSTSSRQNNECLTSSLPSNESSSATSLNSDCLTLSVETDPRISAAHPSDGARPWTREEDRLILVKVQLGFALEETFFNIRKLLPHREIQEIRERFHVLMKILEEMTNPKECKSKDAVVPQ